MMRTLVYVVVRCPVMWPAGLPGFRRGVRGDRYDGDGQGSQLWAVQHGPLGEASFSAPQAKKILRPERRYTAKSSDFEWGNPYRQVRFRRKSTPYFSVLGTTDIVPHPTFTGLLPGVKGVKFISSIITCDTPDRGRRRGRPNGPNRTAGPRQRILRVSAAARRGAAAYGDAS